MKDALEYRFTFISLSDECRFFVVRAIMCAKHEVQPNFILVHRSWLGRLPGTIDSTVSTTDASHHARQRAGLVFITTKHFPFRLVERHRLGLDLERHSSVIRPQQPQKTLYVCFGVNSFGVDHKTRKVSTLMTATAVRQRTALSTLVLVAALVNAMERPMLHLKVTLVEQLGAKKSAERRRGSDNAICVQSLCLQIREDLASHH